MFVVAITRNVFILAWDPALYQQCVDATVEYIREKYGNSVHAVVVPEAKGFAFASTVAWKLGLRFIPIRKAGKLSGDLLQGTFKNRLDEVNLNFSGEMQQSVAVVVFLIQNNYL